MNQRQNKILSICLPWNWSGLLMFNKNYSSMYYYCLQNIQNNFIKPVSKLSFSLSGGMTSLIPFTLCEPHQLPLGSSRLSPKFEVPFIMNTIFFSVLILSNSCTILWFTSCDICLLYGVHFPLHLLLSTMID